MSRTDITNVERLSAPDGVSRDSSTSPNWPIPNGRSEELRLQPLPLTDPEIRQAKPLFATVLSAMKTMLPPGSAVAAAWRDWSVGSGCRLDPPEHKTLRRLAEHALAQRNGYTPVSARCHVLAWGSEDDDGEGCMSLAIELPSADLSGQVKQWLSMGSVLLRSSLAALQAEARIESLEKSKRLQQALYEIADLSGADLEMNEMLRRIHGVVASLMYARNCFIALYNSETDSVRFLYFDDELDDWVTDPSVEFDEISMPNSLTFALLRHGKPVYGPSAQLRARFNVPRDMSHGPDSVDWLGVPMLRDGTVAGLVVVQSYDRANVYDEGDRALLGYVAQHILTALDRRHAHVDLEQRVLERTRDLQRANRELEEEVIERRRAEKLQRTLFRITELAINAGSAEEFYAEVHAAIGHLLDARNFYIALCADQGRRLDFVYAVDERNLPPPQRPVTNGLTEYLIRQRRPLLLDPAAIKALVNAGEIVGLGTVSECWLGAPLLNDQEVIGVIAVQSYDKGVQYSPQDKRLLAFVAHNIAVGLGRQRSQEERNHAHAELERRVQERTYELAEANRRLVAQIGERMRAEQRLIHQATHDALTGLPNRTHFADKLSLAVRQAAQPGGNRFAVLFLDLDRFKLVNDSIGHAAGDELLIEISNRIRTTVSSADVVARLGGDEFAILVPRPSDDTADSWVDELAGKLLLELGRSLRLDGREIFPSASIGVALWDMHYSSGEEMLRDADAAMYRAKAHGRNRVTEFDQEMRDEAMQILDLEADLRRAIINEDFRPYYQPIVCLDTGDVIGHEALLRWHHEARGVLLPADFINLGEDTGLIERVDWLIYTQVVQEIARGGTGYISVNVSPRHFRSADFASRLLGMFDVLDADPSRLRIEITEIALLEDAPRTLRTLSLLREHGILAQLDDFGTGFSALSYLHRFPISALKIDRSFVAGLGNEGRAESEAVVRAILALAGTLGIDTICEGIEREDQAQALRDLGAYYGQGFLFGRPEPRY